ncbi:DUF3459 domain-containing protein, partial [Pseudomonas sp. DC418]|uniref:DUF3459 domain-containing protein n=1 Tax=Pseudomonas sp. DC418 TaxID=3418478 RepID=UPI003D2D9679
ARGRRGLGGRALGARGRRGNGTVLRIDLNLAATPQPTTLPAAEHRLFDSSDTQHPDTALSAYSCVISLLAPGQESP